MRGQSHSSSQSAWQSSSKSCQFLGGGKSKCCGSTHNPSRVPDNDNDNDLRILTLPPESPLSIRTRPLRGCCRAALQATRTSGTVRATGSSSAGLRSVPPYRSAPRSNACLSRSTRVRGLVEDLALWPSRLLNFGNKFEISLILSQPPTSHAANCRSSSPPCPRRRCQSIAISSYMNLNNTSR